MFTKSDLLLYQDAPLHLWAMKNDRVISRQASAYQQFLRRQSAEVETLAGIRIAEDYPAPSVVYGQMPFTSGQFHARTDYLISHPGGLFDLVEVKSSTRVKPEHILDAAFQALVVSDHHPLSRIFILHINSDYAKEGDVDPTRLFTKQDVTEQVLALLPQAGTLREEALALSRLPLEKVFDPATQTPLIPGCTRPASCICPDLCFPPLPDYPIYQLPLLGKKAADLAGQGIFALSDIPETYRLSETQRRHVKAARGEPVLDRPGIRSFLSNLEYPLHFLDYETYPAGVPILDGYRPYEHVVFQFSLQVLDRPGVQARAIDFLHTKPTDPAQALAAALEESVDPSGSVIVWNQSFEKARNSELAGRLPGEAAFFEGINRRLVDLMDVFKKGLYVHRDFNGSASLKSVLPVLVPELNYDLLEISQGDEAMIAWQVLAFDPLTESQRQQLTENLLRYCRTDTEAMLRIWLKLSDL